MKKQDISSAVKKTAKGYVVRNPDKLREQQRYYSRLKSKGLVKKQTYNVKPVSAV